MSRAQPPPVIARADDRRPKRRAPRAVRRGSRSSCRRSPIPTRCCASWSRRSHASAARAAARAREASSARATLAVVQIGDGKTPAVPLAALRPPDATRHRRRRTAAASIRRATRDGNGAVARASSIHAADAAQVYVNVKPLFDEAYRELGYPNGDFDEAIVKAIRMLNAHAGRSPTDPVLLKRAGYFEHEDARCARSARPETTAADRTRESRAQVLRVAHAVRGDAGSEDRLRRVELAGRVPIADRVVRTARRGTAATGSSCSARP